MVLTLGRHRAIEYPALPPRARSRVRYEANPMARRQPCKDRGPIAGLRRYREVVTAPQTSDNPDCLSDRRALRYDDHAIEIAITRQHPFCAAKHQRVDRAPGTARFQRADKWRSQQHVSEPPQCDDENARVLVEIAYLHSKALYTQTQTYFIGLWHFRNIQHRSSIEFEVTWSGF